MRRNVVGPACALVLWVVSGCSFQASEVPGDGIGPNTVTVGFAADTSLEDESSGALHIAVQLSGPADTEVTVHYAADDISATKGSDYTATDGTLTFAAGETSKTIDDITILSDSSEEGDEIFEIKLSAATGAMLGSATHTVTISANVLPRVQLSVATSQAMENVATTFVINLSAPSPTPIVVPFTVGGGTATAADFSLGASGSVTFPANDTAPQVVTLGVVDDALNEDDETVTITLGQVNNAVVGAIAAQTHTIQDNDPLPVVTFTTAGQTIVEGSGGATTNVDAIVSLTPVSGRDVVVQLAPTGTATLTTDYTFAATTVTIPAGQTSVSATVSVVDDAVAELPETVVLTMTVPVTPHAVLGGTQVHTVTITDACFGTGTSLACFDPAPAGATVLPASIDTTNASQCETNQPPGWITAGQPAACFIIGNSISMGGTTNVTGSRPLVLVAATTIVINQTLDAASHNGKSGPGSISCNFPTPQPVAANGAGGGAGGSFMTIGGAGGSGNGGAASGGAAAAAVGAPAVLRGGCRGEAGGNAANGDQTAPGGEGGGVVYLVAGTSITISSTGVINVSGAGAAGGSHFFVGGSGGGSGGMIKLSAPAAIQSTGILIANGGGGSQGADNNTFGSDGFDPSANTATTPANGGSAANAGGSGGKGFAGSAPATAGTAGNTGNAGGGGGGGGGFIETTSALGGTVSAGLVKGP